MKTFGKYPVRSLRRVQPTFEALENRLAPATWSNGVGNNLWSVAGNWLEGLVPGADDVAIFDNTSVSNSVIDSAYAGAVKGIDVKANYSGTISFQTAGKNLAIGMSGFTLAGGTFNATNAGIISVAGNWTKSGGTFTAGTASTVNLTGSNQTITGSTTFNNLTDTVADATLTFDVNGVQTVNGSLTIHGTPGHRISLKSSSPGTQWRISPQGAAFVAYAKVEDSDNFSNAVETIHAVSSEDKGNNSFWKFVAGPLDVQTYYGLSDGTALNNAILFPDPANPGQFIRGDGAGQTICIIAGSNTVETTIQGSVLRVADGSGGFNLVANPAYAGSNADVFSTQLGVTNFGVPTSADPNVPYLAIISENGLSDVPTTMNNTGEQNLDIQWAHAIAPRANIIYILPKNSNLLTGFQAAISLGIDPSAISCSFGTNEPTTPNTPIPPFTSRLTNSTWTTYTISYAAGDQGGGYQQTSTSTFQYIGTSEIGSDPAIVQVGGTTIKYADMVSHPNGDAEAAWGDGIFGQGKPPPSMVDIQNLAGTGGFSQFQISSAVQQQFLNVLQTLRAGSSDVSTLSLPLTTAELNAYFMGLMSQTDPAIPVSSYTQQFTLPDGMSRLGPDLALQANPGYITASLSHAGVWTAGGSGTSVAAPQFAALVAIANQGRALRGLPLLTGSTETLPMLYRAPQTAFNDIILGNNGYPTGTGFDLATGLGAPRAGILVPYLSGDTYQPYYAVGSGAGVSNFVNIYNSQTNVLIGTFRPYAAGYESGVQVVVGDVTGDGVPDVITAPAPGSNTSANVCVFSGADLFVSGGKALSPNPTPVSSFFAYAPGFLGGVTLALGNVSGGIMANGVVSRTAPLNLITGGGAGAGPEVIVWSNLTSNNPTMLASFNAFASTFTGGVSVAAGDTQGTGFADIIVGAGAGADPHVVVYSGQALITSNTMVLLQSFEAFAVGFRGGVNVAAGDVNGDGCCDILTGAGRGAGPQVNIFSGFNLALLDAFFAFDMSFGGGVLLATRDIAGLAYANNVLAASGLGGSQARIFSLTIGTEATANNSVTQSPIANIAAGQTLGGIFIG